MPCSRTAHKHLSIRGSAESFGNPPAVSIWSDTATLQTIMRGASFRSARKWDEPQRGVHTRRAGRQRPNQPGCQAPTPRCSVRKLSLPAVAAAPKEVGRCASLNMCMRIFRYKSCPNRGLPNWI
ncbi:hypothetical protein LZ32DRAFT_333784 [Colletotrichum eremochloae]|nr:hypothetical protein LZ32DRAFT_333784 [Colletotrichum eremochloae]